MAISFEESRAVYGVRRAAPMAYSLSSNPAVAAVDDSETWSRQEKYRWYESYSDDKTSTVDDLKNIVMDQSQINLTQETNSQYIPFQIQRYWDGVDLTGMTLQIHFVNKYKDEDYMAPVNVEYSESKIRFGWLVTDSVTYEDGDIDFEICAFGVNEKGEKYVWRTRPNGKLNILKSLSGNGVVEPSTNWYTQLNAKMDEKIGRAMQYAEEAKTAADQAGMMERQAADSASAAAISEQNAAASVITANAKADEAAESAADAAGSASTASAAATESTANAETVLRNEQAIQDVEANLDLIKSVPTLAQETAANADSAKLYAEMAQQVSQGSVGYYATPEALRSAHSTAFDGNWAIVGSTDTVWVWVSDNGDWIDTNKPSNMNQYYTKTEVQTMVQGAHSNSYTITVPASGWADGELTFQGVICTKSNTVAVSGVTADTLLSLGRYISGDLDACRSYVCQDTGAGTVTFWSASALADFTVNLVEVK